MAITGFDLSQIHLQDALDLALLVEEEARDRYVELADSLELHHTPEAAAFFRKMARIEEGHRESLERRRETTFPGAVRVVTREMLWDVEAPDYDVARVDMLHEDALRAAMASEVKAHDFFAEAVDQVTDPEVRALFLELKLEEEDHQRWVQQELDRLPARPRKDFVVIDEPVAQ